MAELDKDSYLHWKEDLYNEAASRREGSRFWTDAARSQFLEGKVGYRESVGLMNLPPTRSPGSVTNQGTT